MKEKRKNGLFSVLRFAPLIVCVIFIGVYLSFGQDVTVERLLHVAPEEPLFAALFLILLYGAKSLTVFFPIIVLHGLAGFLFEPAYALLVSGVGMLLELSAPYWIGRAYGTGLAKKLISRYPKLGEVIGEEADNNFRMSFFLRIIACMPKDVVSIYFGATKAPFWICLAGSFLGSLPGMATGILLGRSITDPTSPMFWVSVGLTVVFFALSFLIYFLWESAKNRRDTKRKAS